MTIQYPSFGEHSAKAEWIFQIHQNTTNDQFSNLYWKNREYKTDETFHGFHPLGMAADKENMGLVTYIVKYEMGRDLINRGSGFCTPLLDCIVLIGKSRDPESREIAFKASQLLCELGANVNLANRKQWNGRELGCFIPKGVTPLWVAVEKIGQLGLIKLLLVHGGDKEICGELSDEGRAQIEIVEKEIRDDMFNDVKTLIMCDTILPKDLMGLIVMKITCLNWRRFLLKV